MSVSVSVPRIWSRLTSLEMCVKRLWLCATVLLEMVCIGLRASVRDCDAGAGESGKSTIVKQMRILHVDGFDSEFVFNADSTV